MPVLAMNDRLITVVTEYVSVALKYQSILANLKENLISPEKTLVVIVQFAVSLRQEIYK